MSVWRAEISGGDVGERIENGGFGREKVVLFRQPGDDVDEKEAAAYDDSLEKMEKKWMPSQEAFYIMSHSFVE